MSVIRSFSSAVSPTCSPVLWLFPPVTSTTPPRSSACFHSGPLINITAQFDNEGGTGVRREEGGERDGEKVEERESDIRERERERESERRTETDGDTV